VHEETINSWVNEREEDDDEGLRYRLKGRCSRKVAGATCEADGNVGNTGRGEDKPMGAVTLSLPSERVRLSRPAQTDPRDSDALVGNGSSQIGSESSIDENGLPIDNSSPSSGNNSGTCDSPRIPKYPSSLGSIPIPERTTTSPPSAPCKLLTHLNANPSADITQMLTASDEEEEMNPTCADDGIPCSRAYRMLMHYATTETKLDAVAHILEEGCVPNAGPGGGCKVKNTTMWKALDGVCL